MMLPAATQPATHSHVRQLSRFHLNTPEEDDETMSSEDPNPHPVSSHRDPNPHPHRDMPSPCLLPSGPKPSPCLLPSGPKPSPPSGP
ncbi:hypothetical protein OYC64_021994 [Pagothenia borchgrevinki]|uniref:Uncharacterized protein n=1 Tax=Pagothenia borchgrevinki TaxID=8213 RepID=A0ABD2G1T6_PAGBO